MRTADLHVGSSVGSIGTLTVDAESMSELSGRDASENRGPIMFVGGRGTGVANVRGGVSIGGNAGDTNGVLIGGYGDSPLGGTGTLNVDGASAHVVSTDNPGFVNVGHNGNGFLNVTNGGNVGNFAFVSV